MCALLTNALDRNNKLVHVDDVANGNSCACHCPKCGVPLCAKNSSKEGPGRRIHHFAHARGFEKCEGAFETSLHMLAKEVLLELGQIMLPQTSHKDFPYGLVKINNIEIEKWDEQYKIRPDVEGVLEDGRRLLIEFRVSHKVDENKRQIIIINNLLCIEIDVNYQAVDIALMKEFLIGSTKYREWIVPKPKLSTKEKGYYPYVRNPLYNDVRDALISIVNNGTLLLYPFNLNNYYLFPNNGGIYDLKQWGYEFCGESTKHRGIKTDLLFCKGQGNDKNYLCINIRGRRRSGDFEPPVHLRIVDIVLRRNTMFKDISQLVADGDLSESQFIKVYYYNF